jgi:DNA replication protein DnaC
MSFTKWGGVLGDKVLATAILDGLLHYAKVVSLRGDSSRLQTASPSFQEVTG